MNDFIAKLNIYFEKGLINTKLKTLIQDFYNSYQQALAPLSFSEQHQKNFEKLIELVIQQVQHPYPFSIFHRCLRQPFDYYQFGLDFIRPFIDFDRSKLLGMDSLQSIQNQIKEGGNVILFANHQTEPDPQVISLLLEKIDSKLASEMIFVAGHRVISDPMAVPMSLGRNLLCIYSKKYLPPTTEEKTQKILHNQRTLKKMQEMLHEGGACIYVAPSGGRDRLNTSGEVSVAPFDSQSIELFWLMGQHAEKPTHFYPLALQTYHLMPPPRHVQKELGEKRTIHVTPVSLAFGKEIDMENFPNSQNLDKSTKRKKRADYIWNQVRQDYKSF